MFYFIIIIIIIALFNNFICIEKIVFEAYCVSSTQIPWVKNWIAGDYKRDSVSSISNLSCWYY